jgi:hypothetical protein
MYNCYKCGRTTKPGQAANKVVVATREKFYRNVVKEKPRLDEETGEERPVKRRFDRRSVQYNESRGTEIVKEVDLCNKCAGVEEKPESRAEKESRQLWWSPGSLDGVQVG